MHAIIQGVQSKVLEDSEVLERCFYSMVNEGFKILETSSDILPEEIDFICVQKFGWPRVRGGPMWWAEKENKLVIFLLFASY